MEGKTLLDLLKEEKKDKVEEQKVEKEEEKKVKEEKKPQPKKQEKTINPFSAASYSRLKQDEKENEELTRLESKVDSVIEKPNYDLTESLTEEERKKIFVLKQDKKEEKPKPKKFKIAIFSILFAIFGIWGLVNVGQIGAVNSKYQLNLVNYVKNLATLDAANSKNLENLFETIPEEETSPAEIEAQSNWFDRFCNFIAGLFGG